MGPAPPDVLQLNEPLGYVVQYDEGVVRRLKGLIGLPISSQHVPSIIGATENSRITDFDAFSMSANNTAFSATPR